MKAYKLHKIFSMLAFMTIVIFWTSTLIVELFFSYDAIAIVKSLIVFPGLFILIPSIIATAVTGNVIAKKSEKKELVDKKKKRMPIIALMGAVVLLPAAIYLNMLASQQLFDTQFYIVQVLELIAGAINITLMSLNIKDSINIKIES